MSLATPRTFTRRSALVATAMLASGVRAQPSSKPLRIVVAFAPGSGNDITARDLARYMGELLKQPVIVENKPGAGGSIGTEYVARAAPDGLTIGFGTSSQMVMNVGLYRSLPFDVDRDLRSVGLVSRTNMLLAGKAAGPKTLTALIADAKANPGKLTFGSAGAGSISHIVGEAFAKAADIQLNHVPYKGNGPAMADLAGGHVDMVFDALSTAEPMAKQGRIRLLAISGDRRNPAAPQVSTFREQGLRDYEAYTWNCLMAPARTPPETIGRLNEALNSALQLPAMRDRLVNLGAASLAPSTPQQADAFGQNERAHWVPFIRSLKLNVG